MNVLICDLQWPTIYQSFPWKGINEGRLLLNLHNKINKKLTSTHHFDFSYMNHGFSEDLVTKRSNCVVFIFIFICFQYSIFFSPG